MKTAIVFLLLALSCCFDIPAAASINQEKTTPKCLSKAMLSAPANKLDKMQKLMCSFSQVQKTNNAESDKGIFEEILILLKDVGCLPDRTLTPEGTSLNRVAGSEGQKEDDDNLAEVWQNVFTQIIDSLEVIGIRRVMFNSLCNLADKHFIKLSDIREMIKSASYYCNKG